MIGFLEFNDDLTKGETSSTGLVFVSYPTAIDRFSGSNFWQLLFFGMLFLFGIDSAFSFIEAVTTTIKDMPYFSGIPKVFLTMVVCLFGFVGSIPFCFNWGFNLLDTVDHYLNTYLLVFIGVIQCMGCGWAFDLEKTMDMSPRHKASALISVLGYWVCLLGISIPMVAIDQSGWGALAFILSQIFVIFPLSYFVSGMKFWYWWHHVLFCGVRRLGYSFTKLGREDLG